MTTVLVALNKEISEGQCHCIRNSLVDCGCRPTVYDASVYRSFAQTVQPKKAIILAFQLPEVQNEAYVQRTIKSRIATLQQKNRSVFVGYEIR